MSSPEIDLYKELNAIKDTLAEIRISIARMEVVQTERTESQKSMLSKVKEIEHDLESINKKLIYATGAVAVIVFLFNQLGSIIFKKIGA